jgi:hypothetical protein
MVGNKLNRQELSEFDKIWLEKCKKFKSYSKCLTVQLSAQPHLEESGAGTMRRKTAAAVIYADLSSRKVVKPFKVCISTRWSVYGGQHLDKELLLLCWGPLVVVLQCNVSFPGETAENASNLPQQMIKSIIRKVVTPNLRAVSEVLQIKQPRLYMASHFIEHLCALPHMFALPWKRCTTTDAASPTSHSFKSNP